MVSLFLLRRCIVSGNRGAHTHAGDREIVQLLQLGPDSSTCGCTGWSKKVPAKFSDTCSVKADWLRIGCLGQWAERGRENANMKEFFCTTLYECRESLKGGPQVV